jgi:hypothetical protein
VNYWSQSLEGYARPSPVAQVRMLNRTARSPATTTVTAWTAPGEDWNLGRAVATDGFTTPPPWPPRCHPPGIGGTHRAPHQPRFPTQPRRSEFRPGSFVQRPQLPPFSGWPRHSHPAVFRLLHGSHLGLRNRGSELRILLGALRLDGASSPWIVGFGLWAARGVTDIPGSGAPRPGRDGSNPPGRAKSWSGTSSMGRPLRPNLSVV